MVAPKRSQHQDVLRCCVLIVDLLASLLYIGQAMTRYYTSNTLTGAVVSSRCATSHDVADADSKQL